MLSNVYITNTSAFLPNAPVSNDAMEAVLGMVGETPSRVRKMILRSNGIQHRYYAIDPITRQATHSSTELAVQAVKNWEILQHQRLAWRWGHLTPTKLCRGRG